MDQKRACIRLVDPVSIIPAIIQKRNDSKIAAIPEHSEPRRLSFHNFLELKGENR